MTNCTRCGASNPTGAMMCERCGVELDDAAAKALIGEVVLANYRVTDVLGRGGMSVVYRARHTMTDQRVALKILPPELAIHASLKTRFLEEAKALARLEHPSIVRLYNFGEESGRFVLAMEFVEGKTFERLIFEEGKVPWPLCARVGVEVCKALEYAHGRGVVHRDIKPSNVLVRADGTATVMDFGIAKMTESSRLTATGQTMGTVRYMSPEQVRGQVVDHRSDIYSLAVSLFEGLAGDTPFTGDTHFDIMSKHLSEPPPLARTIAPATPEAFDAVLQRALAKDKDARYQSAAEMGAALEALLAGVPAAEQRPRQKATGATPLAAGPGAGGAPTTADPPGARAGMTGLASRLEPAFGDDAPAHAAGAAAPARKKWPWMALAGAVVAGGAVALFALRGGGAGQGAAGVADAAELSAGGAPDAAPAEPAWPEPLALDDLRFAVDQRFDESGQAELSGVRVLGPKGRDAAKTARVYAAARKRFIAFAAARVPEAPVVPVPLNLAVVPAKLLCDARLYAPAGATPGPNCANLSFFYEPRTRTLFVADDPAADKVAIPEGAAVHLCRNTPALHQRGCGSTLLDPFFDEIERDL